MQEGILKVMTKKLSINLPQVSPQTATPMAFVYAVLDEETGILLEY